MLLSCNCAKLANFKDFKTCLRGAFFSWTQCRSDVGVSKMWNPLATEAQP